VKFRARFDLDAFLTLARHFVDFALSLGDRNAANGDGNGYGYGDGASGQPAACAAHFSLFFLLIYDFYFAFPSENVEKKNASHTHFGALLSCKWNWRSSNVRVFLYVFLASLGSRDSICKAYS